MRIVVVEHQTVFAFEFVRSIVAAGHEAVFVSSDPELYLRGRRVQDTDLALAAQLVRAPSTADADVLLDVLRPLRPDLVVTISEGHTLAVAEVSRRLGLPHTAVPALRLTRDKGACRARLDAAGVDQPAWRVPSTREAAVRAAEELGHPVVVKPVDGSGSQNVTVARDGAEVLRAVDAVLATADYGRSVRSARRALVEQFMPGTMVSCETLSAGGTHLVLGITDRQLTPLPDQVELGGTFPAPVPDAVARAVERICLAALDAVGFDLGAAHTEIMLTPDGPKIVEINGRMAGGPMPVAMSAALRRDVFADLIDVLTTGRLPRPGPPPTCVGIRAIVADVQGRVTRVTPSPLRGRPEVVVYEIRRAPGDLVRPPRTNRDRCGSVLTVAPDPEDARALALEIATSTRFEVEPEVVVS